MPKRKLTDEQRAAIRAAYAMGGVSYRTLAARYGVSITLIRWTLNPDKINAHNAKWCAANRDRVRAWHVAWDVANPGRGRRYRKAHPDAARAAEQRYRANTLAAPGDGWQTDAWEAALRHVWAGECAYCRRTDQPLTLDHVVPLTRGGTHEPSNLVPACKPCNSSKNAKLLSEWRGGQHMHIAAFAAEVAASVDMILAEDRRHG